MLLPVASIECVLHEECESVCNLYPENGISPTNDWMPCLSAPRCLQLYKWFSDILQIMKPSCGGGASGATNIHILCVSVWSLQESLFELTWGNKQQRKCARIIWKVKQSGVSLKFCPLSTTSGGNLRWLKKVCIYLSAGNVAGVSLFLASWFYLDIVTTEDNIFSRLYYFTISMPDSSSIFISGGSLSKDNRKVNVDVNDHILLIICKVSRQYLHFIRSDNWQHKLGKRH